MGGAVDPDDSDDNPGKDRGGGDGVEAKRMRCKRQPPKIGSISNSLYFQKEHGAQQYSHIKLIL